MKVYLNKQNIVTARSETLKDVEILLSFMGAVNKVVKGEKKHSYKKQYKKQCELCDKVCKGNVGMGIHMSLAHNMSKKDGDNIDK